MVRNWGALLRRVRAMLLRRGRTADDVDDLVQEAWLRLAVYEREIPVQAPGAFMVRTALNLAVSADRARAVRGQPVDAEEVVLVDASPGIEDTVLARERVARMEACLQQLGGRTRAVFVDVRVHGLGYAETARRHGLSVSAVEKHVAKATLLVTRGMEGW